ncbi:hypothetical protein A2Z00_04380 [Candidatus Gottesmanbacteria bacterium RBG_13_45_10]|uniref:Thymidylate kinase-like domain-containing protein n=1 Tax=Candidatus Gottesmanbacteria bacterium RBG_13_45_10 TaxID=1798370 RepID=A0A1F5ZI36_9BACT|nr:MAG: hypothetical protein A2Z00_04380 [Candidatus Gottesmanbacteria bacterium RBG_13_45_10]
MRRGKIIVLEGADGTGKATQKELLISFLTTKGIPHSSLDFPRYADSFFGALAGRMLKGDFGQSKDIPAHLATLPYACDRWLAKDELHQWLSEGKIIVINRYTASSAVYQAAKVPPAQQHDFVNWVYRMEYDIIGLPRENITFYLHMPLEISQQLLEKKGQRTYLGDEKKDIYEKNTAMQETVIQLYSEIAKRYPHWRVIECAKDGSVRPSGEIQKDILDELIRNKIL